MVFQYGDTEVSYLMGKDKRMAEFIPVIGHVERTVDSDLFTSVVHHIIGQQISTKAQQTIWNRMQDSFGKVSPKSIGDASVEELQSMGMTFRKAVWEIMLTIPYGKTMTYGEIAKRIAEQKGVARMSAQAVGGAVGHNSISLIIPCHRVVGTGGSLTGYAGGIDKKLSLLRLEGAMTEGLSIPKRGTAL